MEIRLHLGAHRTGTTRLQQELRRRADHLETRGIAVAWPLQLRPETDWGFAALACLPVLGRHVSCETVRRLAATRAAALARGRRRLVISEENYAGGIDRMVRRGVLYPDIAARAALLAPPFRDDPLTVLFSVRGYAGMFASLYAQMARRRPAPGFDRLKPRMLALPRRWPAILAELAAAFPQAQVLVWPFEDMPGNGLQAVRLLLGERDVAAVDEDLPAVYSSPTAPAIARLNRMRRPEERTRAARRAVIAAFPPGEHPPFRPWTENERAALDAAYAEDLAALRRAPPANLRLVGLAQQPEARHG
ncbi:hypothetical protein GE300_15845 [Rhodobacteraceae bacterium 2CG4]|uniref:Sulfotransferase family protein n=1 Tax=Halovulum marinum TaxID=2662447 RepID=A0A6L5Z4W4_9RHOB|nr:hypothetical protein [Halovulum marinum]MSU91062.1 hypothetical protein [Halovulum marinum]